MIVGIAFALYVGIALILLIRAARLRQQRTNESLFWAATSVSWSVGAGLGWSGWILRVWLLAGGLTLLLVAVFPGRSS